MSIVTRKLIGKELYVNRWFIGGGALAGLLSVGIASLGKTGFNVGALGWITAIIAHGVMLAIYGIMNERKEHALQFVLSLPVSIGDYVRAKLVGLLLCFLLPWFLASGAALILIFAKADIPDGLAVFAVLLSVFMLTNFSLVLCGTLHAMSEALISAVIIVTNMAVSLFMFTVGALPAIQKTTTAKVPDWNPTFWTVLLVELAVFFAALTLPLLFAARRRDFI
ncbi:MAG: hypothetical protein ABI769_16610 [Pseudomonadota bacterium]